MLEIKTKQNAIEFAKLIAESLIDVLKTLTSEAEVIDKSIKIWNTLGIECLGFQNDKIIIYARRPYILVQGASVPNSIWNRLQSKIKEQYGWTLAIAIYKPDEDFEKDFQVYSDIHKCFGPYIEKLFYNNRKLGD